MYSTVIPHVYLQFLALRFVKTRPLAEESIAAFFVEHELGAAWRTDG